MQVAVFDFVNMSFFCVQMSHFLSQINECYFDAMFDIRLIFACFQLDETVLHGQPKWKDSC